MCWYNVSFCFVHLIEIPYLEERVVDAIKQLVTTVKIKDIWVFSFFLVLGIYPRHRGPRTVTGQTAAASQQTSLTMGEIFKFYSISRFQHSFKPPLYKITINLERNTSYNIHCQINSRKRQGGLSTDLLLHHISPFCNSSYLTRLAPTTFSTFRGCQISCAKQSRSG